MPCGSWLITQERLSLNPAQNLIARLVWPKVRQRQNATFPFSMGVRWLSFLAMTNPGLKQRKVVPPPANLMQKKLTGKPPLWERAKPVRQITARGDLRSCLIVPIMFHQRTPPFLNDNNVLSQHRDGSIDNICLPGRLLQAALKPMHVSWALMPLESHLFLLPAPTRSPYPIPARMIQIP